MKFTACLCAAATFASVYGHSPIAFEARSSSCTFTGYYDNQITVGSGGPGQAPDNSVSTWFGISINSGTEKKIAGNSIKNGWQTIPSSSTGTAQNIDWNPSFSVGSFSGCKVSYLSKETSGTPGTPSHGLGDASAACSVVFDC